MLSATCRLALFLPATLGTHATVTQKLAIQYSTSSHEFQMKEFASTISFRNESTIEYKSDVEGWFDLTLQSATVHSVESYLAAMRMNGFLEGYATCKELQQSYLNFYADNFGDSKPDRNLLNFMIDNFLWMQQQATTGIENRDSYWLAVKGSLQQLAGITEGYYVSPCVSEKIILPASFKSAGVVVEKITLEAEVDNLNGIENFGILHMIMMQAWGDLYTISTKLQLDSKNITSGFKEKRIVYPDSQAERDLRCSSLFKVLPDYSDIIFGHATWCSYIALGPRTFKHYNLPSVSFLPPTSGSESPPVASAQLAIEMRQTHFSSAPGLLASLDDFYLVSSPTAQLAVIETTHDVYNPKLFSFVTPQSNYCWIRAIVANTLATDGASWARHFSTHPSGTYTNQWQVLDATRFRKGEKPAAGLFTLLEEIPGTVESRDMTDYLLANLYWGSYNIPYFQEISDISGNTKACELGLNKPSPSNASCWADCPRANIFRERQSRVQTIDDFKRLINYNDFVHDPLSLGSPSNAVASRRDLEVNPHDRYPSGATDGKVSSVSRMLASPAYPAVDIRLGPTSDDQKPFCWSDFKKHYTHFGQPDCFEYKWTTLQAA